MENHRGMKGCKNRSEGEELEEEMGFLRDKDTAEGFKDVIPP